MTKLQKTISIILLIVAVGLTAMSPHILPCTFAEESSLDDCSQLIEGIVNWKKSKCGGDNELSDYLHDGAGSSVVDWYAFALMRAGYDYRADYIDGANKILSERYRRQYKLDKTKSTEWHRIALALSASGCDVTKCGTESDINLVADGVYNRVDEQCGGILSKQGVNGLIWGLITLDSGLYKVPENAVYTREKIIAELLTAQNEDGSFSIVESTPDIDTTAMAVTALSRYLNCNFDDVSAQTIQNIAKSVEDAIAYLSESQQINGDFLSWESANCESTAQVVIALCSAGINPNSDSRFLKNGNSAWNGLLHYRNADGGFLHTSDGTKTNDMATEQALLAVVAMTRFLQNNDVVLYDLSDVKPFDGVKPDAENESNTLVVTLCVVAFVLLCCIAAVVVYIVKKHRGKISATGDNV